MIKLSKVSFKYKDGTHVLHDISLEIEDGEFVYITGTTGSGKSTIIKLLDTEVVPTKGTVMVNGINVGKLRYSKVPMYRRKIGVVFQEYRLLEKKTIFENVAYALEVVDKPTREVRRRAREVLKLVGLQDKMSALAKNVSGGQAQRTAIARAIANKPKVLLCDEPTGSLDPKTSEEIYSIIEKINKELGTTIVIVTHDAEMVRKHPKRTIKLEEGYIVDDRFGLTIDDIVKQENEEIAKQLEITRQVELKTEEDFKKELEAQDNV